VKPERLLFLIPYDRKQYEKFCRSANQYFPTPLPEYIAHGNPFLNFLTGGASGLQAVIYFEKDWTPRFVPFKASGWRQPDNADYPLSSMLKRTMQPVFEQLQIPYVSSYPLSKDRIVLRAVLISSLIVMIILLFFLR